MPKQAGLHALSLILILSLSLSACLSSASISNSSDAAPLTATLHELTGLVEVKPSGAESFRTAAETLVLQPGAEVRTGDDGRARIDLSDGTRLRVGPSSSFALQSIQNTANGPSTIFALYAGQLWVLLKAGVMEIHTSSGVASVRGSYMSVKNLTDGQTKTDCLEGDCGFDNDGGSVDLIAGQSTTVVNQDDQPQSSQMSPEDIQEFLEVNPEAAVIIPAVTATQGAIVPTASPTPQPAATPLTLGPEAEDFPANFNPLTGQPVQDVAALDLPAMLISVSNFPVVARPQAGLSYASYVFEISITEGATRFLAAFYGDFPQIQTPVTGDCEVRTEPFDRNGTLLGNRVWLDLDGDGYQDGHEPGVGGVCVKLYDAGGELVEESSTDSNGYYGFHAQPGNYMVEFERPDELQFTHENLGDEDHDSDAVQSSGRAAAQIQSDLQPDVLSVDAGLVPLPGPTATPEPADRQVDGEVGPVRSGRLVYADLALMFQDSCLVYAFASEEVLEHLPQCAMVAHEDAGGGSMMDITRMRAVAEDNEKADTQFNYASNMFTDEPPAGGSDGTQLNVFYALLNQSGWTYDPLYESYLRFTDNASEETAGELHPDTDRLTGRQLHFENVAVLFTETDVVSPTNIDIHLEQGARGPALLFRDGQAYQIRWSTLSGEYEKETGRRRPIQWQYQDGSPFPLKPGHTWVVVVTTFSSLSDEGDGTWRIRYAPPAGEAR